MEVKRNEATLNRPDGDRVLDGTYVFVDIPSYIRQIKDEKAWEKNDRNGITVFKSDSVTIVVTALQKGAIMKDSQTDEFLTVQVLDGNIRLTTPEGDIDAVKFQQVTFHPQVKHSIEALSESIILLTTFRDRENFRER